MRKPVKDYSWTVTHNLTVYEEDLEEMSKFIDNCTDDGTAFIVLCQAAIRRYFYDKTPFSSYDVTSEIRESILQLLEKYYKNHHKKEGRK